MKIDEDKIRNPEKYYLESRQRTKRGIKFLEDDNIDYVPSQSESNYFENVECFSGMFRKSIYDKEFDFVNKNYLSMISSNLFDFYCGSMHCTVRNLSTDESALIRLRFRLWARNMALVKYFKINQLSYN